MTSCLFENRPCSLKLLLHAGAFFAFKVALVSLRSLIIPKIIGWVSPISLRQLVWLNPFMSSLKFGFYNDFLFYFQITFSVSAHIGQRVYHSSCKSHLIVTLSFFGICHVFTDIIIRWRGFSFLFMLGLVLHRSRIISTATG